MKWNLKEVPRHFFRQIDGDLVEIDTKSHDDPMSFTRNLFVFHAQTLYGLWKRFNHGIFMAFTRKVAGFSLDLTSS